MSMTRDFPARGSRAREIRARGIVRGRASGSALVSPEAISFLGDIEIRTGLIVGTATAIRGGGVAGRVLVIPHSIGSAGAWRFLYQLSVHGTGPAAIIQRALPDSSLVQGAILAKVPIVCEPEADVLSVISDGDEIEVEADGPLGIIRVLRANTNGDVDAVG
jgi:predicted aconitase with swiveling domain